MTWLARDGSRGGGRRRCPSVEPVNLQLAAWCRINHTDELEAQLIAETLAGRLEHFKSCPWRFAFPRHSAIIVCRVLRGHEVAGAPRRVVVSKLDRRGRFTVRLVELPEPFDNPIWQLRTHT